MNNQDIILVVDDDIDHLSLVKRYVDASGSKCIAVNNGTQAMAHLEKEEVSLVVTDMVMPEMDGMELLQKIKRYAPEIEVIIMTGFSQQYSYIDVIQAGAADFIAKPFKKDEFIAKLKRIYRERDLVAELQEAKKKADMANRAKTVFLNTMGHELRTPMNGIIGFSELLSFSELPAEEKEYVSIISQSAHHLMQLIEQILDYSANSEKKGIQELSHFYINTLIEAVFFKAKPKATEKNLHLGIEIEDGLISKLLFGDQLSLIQILTNLLDNAITYTDSGVINVQVKKVADVSESIVELQFSVSDSGCGIDIEKQEEIFQPFTQEADYMTREHEGAGLGLAVCTKLITMLEGNIWVNSNKGEGSTFYFTVQLDTVCS